MERIGVALSSAIGVCLAGSFLKCYPGLSMKYVWFRELLLKYVAVSEWSLSSMYIVFWHRILVWKLVPKITMIFYQVKYKNIDMKSKKAIA